MKNKFTKALSIILAVFSIFCLMGNIDFSVAAADVDDFEPVFRFAVASDTHITELDHRNAYRTQEMFKQMYELAASGESGYYGMDAIAIVGDISDNGKTQEFKNAKQIIDSGVKDGTEMVITMGNHDYYFNKNTCKATFESMFGEASAHKVIGGYHFITVNLAKNGISYDDETVAWVEEELAKAYADGADKPIFVFQHVGNEFTIAGTCNHVNYNGVDELAPIFKKYSNVVNFSGHSHFACNDECSVYQKDYTCVGTGTFNYSTRTMIDGTWIDMPNRTDIAQHWVIDIDKDHNVRMRVWDLTKKAFVGDTFMLTSFNKEDFVYTEDRFKDGDLFFADDAKINIDRVTSDAVYLSFPMVPEASLTGRAYKVEVKDANGNTHTEYTATEYYNDNFDTILKTSVGGLKPETEYTVNVYAVNSLFCWEINSDRYDAIFSAPITTTFKTAAKTENAPAEILDVKIDAANKTISDASVNNLTATVLGKPIFSHDDSIGMDVITFTGEGTNAVKFASYFTSAHTMKNNFSLECYFKYEEVKRLPTEGASIFSSEASGGFALDIAPGKICKFSLSSDSGTKSAAYKMQPDTYYHLTATYDGNELKLYIDGVEQSSATLADSIFFPYISTIYLGADTAYYGECERTHPCTIALARVYNRTLGADEVQGLYKKVMETHQHVYSSEVTAPTCEEKGYTTHTCTICGESYTDSEAAALGHNFGEWIADKGAGNETRICTTCSKAETRELPQNGSLVLVFAAVGVVAAAGIATAAIIIVKKKKSK